MSALNICFTSLSTIKSVSYSQLKEAKTAWETFRTVELYNSNISTQRGTGNKSLIYYQFLSTESQTYYRKGSLLYFSELGYNTIVEKN